MRHRLPSPYRPRSPRPSLLRTLIVVTLIIIGLWAALQFIKRAQLVHAESIAHAQESADQAAIERVNARHLIPDKPTPTPQVVQVADPAVAQKLEDLAKEVQDLK